MNTAESSTAAGSSSSRAEQREQQMYLARPKARFRQITNYYDARVPAMVLP